MQKTDEHPDVRADNGHPPRVRLPRKPVILGSSSPWRVAVLQARPIAFTTMSPDIDEKAIRHHDARFLTTQIALAKAAALLPRIEEPSLLITCDQVAVFDGAIREKPVDKDEAVSFLCDYSEGLVQTVTAVVVTDTARRRSRHAVDVATVYFREIPDDAVVAAVERGDVMNSCGAFTLEDPAIAPYVESVQGEGSEEEIRTSIAGLPIRKTMRLLLALGWRP
jgi:septum formation protein